MTDIFSSEQKEPTGFDIVGWLNDPEREAADALLLENGGQIPYWLLDIPGTQVARESLMQTAEYLMAAEMLDLCQQLKALSLSEAQTFLLTRKETALFDARKRLPIQSGVIPNPDSWLLAQMCDLLFVNECQQVNEMLVDTNLGRDIADRLAPYEAKIAIAKFAIDARQSAADHLAAIPARYETAEWRVDNTPNTFPVQSVTVHDVNLSFREVPYDDIYDLMPIKQRIKLRLIQASRGLTEDEFEHLVVDHARDVLRSLTKGEVKQLTESRSNHE